MKQFILSIVAAMASTAVTGAPATGPAEPAGDPTVDSLLADAQTQPAIPASAPSHEDGAPSSPFAARPAGETRPGVIETSDGEKIRGPLRTTLDKPVRVWEEDRGEYRDIPFALIKKMEARVAWERDEREWHFKESGSDVKEYSGKTYPARETNYLITLVNGQQVSGSVALPLYQDSRDGTRTYVLHKRDKGEAGQSLKQLVFVKRVEFLDAREPAATQAVSAPSDTNHDE